MLIGTCLIIFAVLNSMGWVAAFNELWKLREVFLASLSLLDELLSDSRVDEIGPEDFLALLQTEEGNMISLLLDQTDAWICWRSFIFLLLSSVGSSTIWGSVGGTK